MKRWLLSRRLLIQVAIIGKKGYAMDLTTKYMGLSLKNPLIASPSPLSHNLKHIKELANSGVAAIVIHSLFEEQLFEEEHNRASIIESYSDSFAESLSYFPEYSLAATGPTPYLNMIKAARAETDIPIIASLNGSTMGNWTLFSKEMEDSGASAIELNLYSPIMDLDITGNEIEQLHLDIFTSVKKAVSIPVAVKLSPMYTSFVNVAKKFDSLGADGIVILNRYIYPDIDLDTLEVTSAVHLSDKNEIRLPLALISSLRNYVKADIAATTGVESVDEVIKYLLVGANVVMTTSAILKKGLHYVNQIISDLNNWLESRGCGDLNEIRGTLSHSQHDDHNYYRSDYVAALQKANRNPYGWKN